MSPITYEDNNHMRLVMSDIVSDMISRKWLFGNWTSGRSQSDNSFSANARVSADRLRQAIYRDPGALQALFDLFASAVSRSTLEDDDPVACTSSYRFLTLAAVDEIHSLDALRARVDATPADVPAPKLIEHLLAKIDGGDGGDGGDGLNFRSAPLPSCVAAAVGPQLPENSLTFAMGPRWDDDDGGQGLFVCVPVTGAMGAYGALALWPSPPEVCASEDLHVALGWAEWTDSWNDASLFGGARYRSVLVCRAHRSASDHRLPYKIGPPRYLVVCAERPRAKPARRREQQPDRRDEPATAEARVHRRRSRRLWQPLVLGALLLVGGYMVHRYSVFTVQLFAFHWPAASFEMFAPMLGVFKLQ